MSCLLCFGVESEELLINLVSAEGQRLNIASILHMHFGFCFFSEPDVGFVCQKCWVKVSVFHDFYLHVKHVHCSEESIFVESIQADVRPQDGSESDRWDQESMPEATGIDSDAHDAIQDMETYFEENKPIVAKNAECDLLVPLKEEVIADAQEQGPRRGRSHKKIGSEKVEKDLKAQKATEPQSIPSIPKKRGRHRNGDTSKDFFPERPLRGKDASADANHNDDGSIALKSETIETNNGSCRADDQKQSVGAKKRKSKTSLYASMKDYRSDETDEGDEESNDPTYHNHQVDEAIHKNAKLTNVHTFQCKTCKTNFSTFAGLSRHIKLTHDLKAFQCKESRCFDSFDTQKELEDHAETMHKRQECPHCKKMIVAHSFDRHIINNHTSGAEVVCESCGKCLKNRAAYNGHKKRYHDRRGDYQCDVCGQKFKAYVHLKDHIYLRHVHGPQTCNICGHISPSRKSFNQHKRIHIPGDKDRFKCDVCGRGFRKKDKLKEHYHIHTGSAGSLHCEFCGKTFRFSSSFSVHRKKMHPR